MKILLDNNKFVSFQAIKMQPKDISASYNLLNQYQSLKRNEEFAEKLFAIFDKYIEQEAKIISSEKGINIGEIYAHLVKMFCQGIEKFKQACPKIEDYYEKVCAEIKYDIGQESDSKQDISSHNEVTNPVEAVQGIKEPTTATQETYVQRAKNITDRHNSGDSYRKIAKEEGVSYAAVRRSSLQYQLSQQYENGTLPQEIKDKAEEYIKTLPLQANKDEIIQWLIYNPMMISADVKTIAKRVESLSRKLNIEEDKLYSIGIDHIFIFTNKPETTINNIDDAVKQLSKITRIEVNREDYINACLKQPVALSLKPATIADKFIKIDEYLQDKNFVFTPEEWLDSFINSLWLLSNSTEKSCARIDALITDKTKHNQKVTKDDIKTLFKELFYTDEETGQNHINEVVEAFKQYGLTREDYELAVQQQKPLIKQNPQTIISKVKKLSEIFIQYGLTLSDCLNVCKKQKSLFYQSPDTVTEHIKAYMFVDKNKYGRPYSETLSNIGSKCLTYSSKKIYLNGIIYPHLKNSFEEFKNVGLNDFYGEFIEYFKNNPGAKCKIVIPNDEMTKHFIETMEKFCKENFNRSVFEYQILDEKEFLQNLKEKKKTKFVPHFHKNKKWTVSNLPKPLSSKPEIPTSAKVNEPEIGKSPQKPVFVAENKNVKTETITAENYIIPPQINSKLSPKILKQLMQGGVLPRQYEKIIETFIDTFNPQIDKAQLRKIFINHPELFLMKLPILQNNVIVLNRNINLNDDKLILDCLLKNPMYFYSSPQQLEENINAIVGEFAHNGLTPEIFMSKCSEKAALLPKDDSIAAKLRAYIYTLKHDANIDPKEISVNQILDEPIAMSEAEIYINKIILPQLQHDLPSFSDISVRKFVPEMQHYLSSHPLKLINIKILNNNMADHFIEIVKDFCVKNFRRNIFVYEKVSRRELFPDSESGV